MPKLLRITTAPISLNVLLPGQMKYMREQGFDVLMVSSDGPELKAVLEREGCRHHIIPMTRRMTPFGDLRCLWLLYKFFRKEKPDLVHSHTPKAGLLSMLAAKMAGVKLRVHTIAGLRYVTTRGFGRQVLIVMEKLTGMAATHVWPNSYSMKAFIERNRLVNPKKLEVIGWGSSNGVNLARYNTAALKADKLNEIKAHIQYDPSLFYFLSVGRIVHDKGMDELLQAFARLHKDHPQIRLVLVGAFEDEVDPVSDTARQLIKTHPAVISAGWSDAVEYYMHISQALVHPSHREGFPNVLMQAGAMGCPVLCSCIDGNIDIVEHRKTGLIFEVKNEEALYREMAWALGHPEELKDYAQTLLQQVQTHYDQRIVQSLLREKYLQLLAAQ
ncbi:MAG: glycosyltransferase family 4 protein [Sphingobacteriales bacterium]|nr:glycosyltransferase family 4 protein [Sphingobacteriales bacterium]